MIETVYFGTYTKKTAEGIYTADFNTETGQLSNLRLLAKENNATYLAFSQKGFLYSVAKDGDQGGIASYNMQGQVINRVLEDGAPLCHVFVDDKRQLVYGANYHKGELLIYRQGGDGSLSLLNKKTFQGSGPHPHQASSHLHFAGLTPDRYLLTCDLGTDNVSCYDVLEDGQLEEIGNYQASPGAGSRHIIFHPVFKIAYLICELNATIEVLIYDGYGQFEHYQTVSTLPEGYTGENACAAIRISKDGRFVYASNRGHDSIAVFAVVGDGVLEPIQAISTEGKIPRDFNLSPDDHYLIVGHQDSDNATVFKRHAETGLLTELSHDFFVPEAVCVAFEPNFYTLRKSK